MRNMNLDNLPIIFSIFSIILDDYEWQDTYLVWIHNGDVSLGGLNRIQLIKEQIVR